MKKGLFLAAIGLLTAVSCNQPNNKSDRSGSSYRNFFDRDRQESGQPFQGFPQQRVNFKNAQTYQGQIVQVIEIQDPSGTGNSMGVLMQTEKGILPVILGPRCYVGGGQNLSPGQTIEVTGSELIMEGSVLLIAQEATTGGATIKLRDNDGFPLWSGWRKS